MKASSILVHFSRSVAMLCQLCPWDFLISSAHLFLGLPGFLLLEGCHIVRSFAQLSVIRAMWPAHFHLSLKILSTRSGILVFCLMVSFVIWSCHLTSSILRSIAVWVLILIIYYLLFTYYLQKANTSKEPTMNSQSKYFVDAMAKVEVFQPRKVKMWQCHVTLFIKSNQDVWYRVMSTGRFSHWVRDWETVIAVQRVARASRVRVSLADANSVARVWPRTSKRTK